MTRIFNSGRRSRRMEMAASVSTGESELVLIPASEIPLMRGVENAGTLPAEIQSMIVFQGGSTTKSAWTRC